MPNQFGIMKAIAARCFTILACWAMVACGKDTRDQFVGEWKSATTDAETHTFIKRSGDDFFISEGKQDLVGKYDEATKSLLIDNGTRKVPVLYIPESDQIVVSAGGKSARFTRVK